MSMKRNLNKEIILATAADLAEEVGLYNITLNRLAEKLHIKSPSLYTYFNGLDDLYASLAIQSMNQLENVIKNAAVGKSKSDALISIANEYRLFAKENPEIYKTILLLPSIERNDVKEAGYAVVCVFNRIVEAYHFNEEHTIQTVRGLRSAIHGFIALEQAGYFKHTVDVDDSFHALVKSLISAMESNETWRFTNEGRNNKTTE